MRFVFITAFLALNLFAQMRVVALSPAANEIIYALGMGKSVVGNTTYCNYPKEAQKVQKVGGYFNPSLERIVALSPDLVVMQQNNYKIAKQLQKLSIKTQIISIDTLKNIKQSILQLGILFGKEQKAKEIVSKIENSLTSLKNILQNKKILIVFGHNLKLTSHVFVAGNNLYLDDIIKYSGNKNAFYSKRKAQPVLGLENIIATNPDIVILLTHSLKKSSLTPNDLLKPWQNLPINASKTNSIYILDKAQDGIPSQRIVYFIKDFKEILQDYAKRCTSL